MLTIQLLGGFAIRIDGTTIPDDAWRVSKAKSLVKALALAHGHALHREALMDMLWPELSYEAAANNLRYNLYVTRRIIRSALDNPELDLVVRHGDMLALSDEIPIQTDVELFESAAAAAQESDDLDALYRAERLYAGELLPEDRYADWTAARREMLRSTHLALLIKIASLHEQRSEYAPAIEALQPALLEEPALEKVHLDLMRLYALSGQRGRALYQYRQLENALARELDAAPAPESRDLYADILAGRFPATPQSPRSEIARPAPARRLDNLPVPTTSFIGRRAVIADVKHLLAENRLVTLVGGGGAGKTRLALAIAAEIADQFADGCWWVELTRISDPVLVWNAVAGAVGVREETGRPLPQTLPGALRPRKLCLVLDNCEHVIEAVAGLVMSLLATCPDIRIIATSREALRVPGEALSLVPPLAIPDPDADISIDALPEFEAVNLFLDRVRQRYPRFSLDEETAPAVVQICRRLDGIPLAIELAAARVPLLSVTEVAGRLDDALGILHSDLRTVAPRHQTLRAALDWSYNLLAERERVLLKRLATFAGGWTLEAAEAVVPGSALDASEVLDGLSELFAKSLVFVEPDSRPTRYRLLETVRQYSLERLVEAGALERIQRRHAEYYLSLAERAEPELAGPDQTHWMELLEADHDNLRAALRWARDTADCPHIGLRLAAALGRFWWARSHYAEGRAWLTTFLERTSACADEIRGKALAGAFLIVFRQGDFRAAKALAEESLALWRKLGDRYGIAWALTDLSMAVGELGDGAGEVALLEESLPLFREVGDQAGIARVLNSLGEAARLQGQSLRAVALYEEALRLWQEIGDRQYAALGLHNIGRVAQQQGDAPHAASLFAEGLEQFQELDNKNGIALCLRGLAGVAVDLGRLEQAVRIFAAADVLCRGFGIVEDVADRRQSEECLASALTGLGDVAFATAWEAGSELPLDDAIEAALTLRTATALGGPSIACFASLSPRESQIAELIEQGCTNPEIAERLGIARRTVDTHVSNILRKLGLTSRAQIAAAARSHADHGPGTGRP